MKPLLDLDKPVQRRSGEPAEIIRRNARGHFCVIALIDHRDGSQFPKSFTLRGSCATDSVDSDNDLINVPVVRKVRVWVGVTKTDNTYVFYQDSLPTICSDWKIVKEFNLEIEVP